MIPFVAAGVLAGGIIAAYAARHGKRRGANLAALLPADLDMLGSPAVVGALGVQLLLFGGFVPSDQGWRRGQRLPASLQERVDLIAPTWKPHGRVDYTWPGPATSPEGTIALFAAATSPTLGVHDAGTTVRSLAHALERLGLSASDFDGLARAALAEMLTWSLPPSAERARLDERAESLTLLVLSFDATPECRAVDDCPRPGPSNELLAATAAAFVNGRAREHGQTVEVVAQWEVAAALRNAGERDHVGTPGVFENTAQIFELMRDELGPRGRCDAGAASDVVLLAHPDHLRRALRIGQTVFAPAAPAPAAGGAPCAARRLVPAMQPYRLDWPTGAPPSGARLDLFAGVAGEVHTAGEARAAAWRAPPYGFFPDGEPQRWARRREVWLCYEVWARAKGVATGIINTSDADGGVLYHRESS